MKIESLRDLTKDELLQKHHDMKEELFNLNMRKALKELDNPLKLRTIRRDIARIETLLTEDGHWSKEIEFENKVIGGAVPKEYIPSIEGGARNALSSGELAGYPVVGCKVCLIDGSAHSVDSSDVAFEQAASMAIEKLLKNAGPVLLEPVMRVQIIVPESNFGAVQGNLLAKRGVITDTRAHGNMRVIDAKVPLTEMFGYSSEIRSATAGRGSFTMEPLNYEKVPEQIAKAILF